MKSALILYPNQLFPREQLPEVSTVILVEEPLYFGVDQEFPLRIHKQKLIMQRASMRRYAEEVLWPAGFDVDYVDLDVFMHTGDVLARTKKFDEVYIFDPIDEVVTRRLLQARRDTADIPAFEFLPAPNFYLSNHEIQGFMGAEHKNVFDEFYQWQRERFNVLIGNDYKPLGGKLMHEPKPAKKLEGTPPSFAVYGDNDFVKEAIKYVDEHFSDNPGGTDFVWPTNHAEATSWLHDFVASRLVNFGPTQQLIDGQAIWLYHSALTPMLNAGLLDPRQVIAAATEAMQKQDIPLDTVEPFIRGVLGRREFTRALYLTRPTSLPEKGGVKAHRKLTHAWYEGSLGISPYDDVIKKIQQHGYASQAERLNIIGNLMLLSEIHPEEIKKVFSELFVDAYDWTVAPNVYGLQHFIDSPYFALPIFSTDSLLERSTYTHDLWADVWDGLYWRFVENHKEELKALPAARTIIQRLDRLDDDRRRIIHYRAEDFLSTNTLL